MRITSLYLRAIIKVLLLFGLLACGQAQAANFKLNVVDQDGAAVTGFRYMLQEDQTFDVDPNNPASNPEDTLSTSFHTSYHGMARRSGGPDAGDGISGHSDGSSTFVYYITGNTNNPRRYYVSVLPYSGYSVGGAPVAIIQPQRNADVTVVVQANPIPTAQISVYLFHDNSSVNGAPDLPQELNPPKIDPDTGMQDPDFVDWSKFNIILEEPAGRYGIAGGQVIQDVFGNPLSTEYQANCDPYDPGEPAPIGKGPCVTVLGDGTVHTSPEGYLSIRNLAPAKYGVIAVPPSNSGWQQSSTIEGTPVIDAWVKADEAPFFIEFGPPGPHVFIGFVKSSANYKPGEPGGFPPLPAPDVGEDAATISGTVTDLHASRPPVTEFFGGRAFPDCWVALNEVVVGVIGEGLYAAPCNDDSTFSIPAVPPGSYELKVFDTYLNVIIATLVFNVDDTGGTCNNGQSCNFDDGPAGSVAVFNWFARINAGIFNDENQDGFWNTGEAGIGPESQDVTLRWRDGTVYQNFPTDNDGLAPFDQVFPFFHWLVAEVSFANKKATGATFVIDGGGAVNTANSTFPDYGEMTPQHQCVDDGTGTGATVGQLANGECPSGAEAINTHTLDDLSWTEAGAVLTVGFQSFLGQTSVMHFGKADYVDFTPPNFDDPSNPIPGQFVGENGGISGIVFYATTRAEDDPRYAAAEEWEPGVPRVQVELYADGDIDSHPLGDWPNGVGDIDWNGDGVLDGDDNIIDDANRDGTPGQRADVDNHPQGNFPGPEDIDNYTIGVFDYGDAIAISTTDSWDDSLPTGCQGQNFLLDDDVNKPTDCFDGLRNFNQIRPAVFDGGYAFEEYDIAELPTTGLNPVGASLQLFYSNPMVESVGFAGLLPGDYIVAAATPSGYEILQEQHKNVDFGDEYVPALRALPVECVGTDHEIPRYLNMQTVADTSPSYPDGRRPVAAVADLIEAPFAGTDRPLCDMKKVPLSAAQNAAAEFFLMTDVPTVANVSGVILNDLANEFDPGNPNFGEKYAPPLLPVGFYDWNGNLINRVHADRFGRYNAVLPSTYTTNLPMPSGMSPNMISACMNDASLVPNPLFNPNNPSLAPEFVVDPFFDPKYSQFCYTFQYMPGVITYLDTPVQPVGAFAGPGQFPVDCELPTQHPRISAVTRRPQDGGGGPFVLAGDRISIQSMNRVNVPNPEWDGLDPADKNIKRDYRFGRFIGKAELVATDNSRLDLIIQNWKSARINARVPNNTPFGDYQVEVTHANGRKTLSGVTLTVGVNNLGQEQGVRANSDFYNIWRVGSGGNDDFTGIQEAIDDPGVAAGDMIIVGPGLYTELVIMHKPVKLQGWGPGVVHINARQLPNNSLRDWRAQIRQLDTDGAITRLPGQSVEQFPFPALSEVIFPTEEGAGIFVLGIDAGPNRYGIARNRYARIDGFTITGASTGGGIVVNGHANYLQIGNNRLQSNAGIYGGGIRIGHPTVSHPIADNTDPDFVPGNPNLSAGDIVYDDAQNNNIRIHHNEVVQNGGRSGAGGGISIHTGADNYDVYDNWVCGNFSAGQGGGIAHFGRSTNGEIVGNTIIFNESFNQGNSVSGGGLYVGGQAPLTPEAATGLLLSPGSGSVVINRNLIRGNLAGAGDGGGIRFDNVNGQDIAQSPGNRLQGNWYRITMFNNMVNNNVAALSGGGVSFENTLFTNMHHNTIAHNDSISTAARAFADLPPNVSESLPAGVVSRLHSGNMGTLMNSFVSASALPGGRATQWRKFSDPVMNSNFVLNNRSFLWSNFDDPLTDVVENGLLPATCDTPESPLTNPNCDVNMVPIAGYSVDLGVLNGNTVTADKLNPRFSFLTNPGPYHNTNITGNPGFENPYFNTARNSLLFPEFTVLQTALAFDEGGNFIQASFGPLSLLEPFAANNPANNTSLLDFHITSLASMALGNGVTHNSTSGRLAKDYDNQSRPAGAPSDIGADEYYVTPSGRLPLFYPGEIPEGASLPGGGIGSVVGGRIQSDAPQSSGDTTVVQPASNAKSTTSGVLR